MSSSHALSNTSSLSTSLFSSDKTKSQRNNHCGIDEEDENGNDCNDGMKMEGEEEGDEEQDRESDNYDLDMNDEDEDEDNDDEDDNEDFDNEDDEGVFRGRGKRAGGGAGGTRTAAGSNSRYLPSSLFEDRAIFSRYFSQAELEFSHGSPALESNSLGGAGDASLWKRMQNQTTATGFSSIFDQLRRRAEPGAGPRASEFPSAFFGTAEFASPTGSVSFSFGFSSSSSTSLMPFTSSTDGQPFKESINQPMSDVPDTFPALVFDPAVAHPLTLPDGSSLREYMHIPKEARRAPLPRLYLTGSLVACLQKYQSVKRLLDALEDVASFKSGGIHNVALAAFCTAPNIISCLVKAMLITRNALAASVQAIFPTFRFYMPRMTIFAVRRISHLTLRAYMVRDDRRRMRSAQADHASTPWWVRYVT